MAKSNSFPVWFGWCQKQSLPTNQIRYNTFKFYFGYISAILKSDFDGFKKAGFFNEYLTSKLASHQLVWSSQPQPTLFETKILELKFFNFLDIKRLILALKQHNLPLFKVLLYKHYISEWSLAIAGRLTPAQLQLVISIFVQKYFV